MTVLVTVLFYGLFLAAISVTFSQIKSSWNEKKYLKMMFCVILILIEVATAAVINHKLNDWKSEQLKLKAEEYRNENTSRREKTLGELAIDAPLPKIYVKGMNPVVNDENFYIEFDNYYGIEDYGKSPLSNSIDNLCDWVDKDNKNELKVKVMRFDKSQVKETVTFSDATLQEKEKFSNQFRNWQDNIPSGYENESMKMVFIDEGYFKVNGNVVLWSSYRIETQPEIINFCYYIMKNSKLYMLSYFTSDSINNQPNDVILTSLNSLRIR